MYDRLLSLLSVLYKKPLAVSLCGLIITALFTLAIPYIKFDNDVKNFLPGNHPHRAAHNRLDDVFGSSEIIIIGVESKNAFSKETVEYIKWLTGKIEVLNRDFPVQNISRELSLTREEAKKLIAAINENELLGKEALKSLLESPERMSEELFWEEGFAKKIAERVSRVSIDSLLNYYRLPVDEVKSVNNTDYIRGEGDRFVVESLIDPGSVDQAAVAAMKKKVKSWDIYRGLLFSDDGTLTAMAVQLNPIDINLRQKLDLAIEKIIKENPRAGLTIYLAGEPVLSDRISSSMGSDLQRLLPFVLLVMLVILILMFRHYEGVLLPMIVIIFSVIWTMGTMAVLRIPMSMVSISVPTVLSAVASAYGIHFMTHYFMSPARSRLDSIMDSMKESGLAIIIAGLTTVAGFGSLVTSDMTHIKKFGIITAIGVFYALAISITLVPALLALRKNEKPLLSFMKKERSGSDFSLRFLMFIQKHLGPRPRIVFAVGILLLCVSVAGITRLEVDMNSMDFFQEGSEMKVADSRLNEQLAGTQRLNINLETTDGSEVITPAVLKKVEQFQKDITKQFAIAGKAVSVNDYLKKMNQEMHGGDRQYFRLPETVQMTRDYLLLYSGDINNMISKKKDKLRIHISLHREKMDELRRVRDYAVSYFDSGFRRENNIAVHSTGFMDMMVEANILVLEGQLKSLIFSLLVVTLLIFMIFRNLRLTLVGLIPLVLGITMNFGIMGFFNIPLNAATALVAAISIGIGIDYSVHFISQFRNSSARSTDVDTALRNTYEGTGRAILSNVASVAAGFLVLMFSQFPIIQQCGGLIAFTVCTTGIGAIIMIPAALKMIQYVEKRNSAADAEQ
ncbi:MAG TPA: MMPL family transporter [Spirochaetota bacterium]|nr:MMPL family transporter [Spirochaetota bacterium]